MNHKVAELSMGELLDHLRKDLQLDPSTDLLPLRGTNGPWITPAIASPWTAGSPTLQYMKDGLGFIHFRGNVSAVAGQSAAPILATPLPEDYRPGVSDYYPALTSGALPASDCHIDTAGVIQGTMSAAGQLWLNSVIFLAEL